LVNNAGIGAFPALEKLQKTIYCVYNTNVFGMALLTQEFYHNSTKFNIINIEEPLQKGFAQGSVLLHQNLQLEV
jgi:NAD(P)-dependent dehydrogenase (short-subunit alcohol dehydrogenase family)